MQQNEAKKNVEKLVKKIQDNGDTLKLGSVGYKFNRFRHKERVKVFGYLTAVAPAMEKGNFEFLSSDAFDQVAKIISENVTVDGMSLQKMDSHWDDHPENFIGFFTTALQFVSFPFLRGGITN